jgi:hypothetical protein
MAEARHTSKWVIQVKTKEARLTSANEIRQLVCQTDVKQNPLITVLALNLFLALTNTGVR